MIKLLIGVAAAGLAVGVGAVFGAVAKDARRQHGYREMWAGPSDLLRRHRLDD